MGKVSETKATCKACGNVYYFGKKDQVEHVSAKLDNCGTDLMCCGGCWPAMFMPRKKAVDPNKCPKCGSRAIVKERVVHEV